MESTSEYFTYNKSDISRYIKEATRDLRKQFGKARCKDWYIKSYTSRADNDLFLIVVADTPAGEKEWHIAL